MPNESRKFKRRCGDIEDSLRHLAKETRFHYIHRFVLGSPFFSSGIMSYLCTSDVLSLFLWHYHTFCYLAGLVPTPSSSLHIFFFILILAIIALYSICTSLYSLIKCHENLCWDFVENNIMFVD